MGSDAPAVALVGAGKRYGNIEALAAVTLTFARGETVAFLGPSGSGKTTLLSLVAGATAPTQGSVRLVGRELGGLKPGRELAEAVGTIHQQFDLVPHLSALQNVQAGRLGHWGLLKTLLSLVWPQEKELALDALGRVGVRERAGLRAALLSGGEQQRIAIARLLVQDPEVIVADEPVSALDPARAEEVIQLLIGMTRETGKTLLASVHSADLARRYFSRLVGLRNGVVQWDLPAAEVDEQRLSNLYELSGLRA